MSTNITHVNIITRVIGNDEVNSVNARELYLRLGIGRDFSNWIKDHIIDLGLVQGHDYEKFNDSASPNLASNRIEYAVTLDVAKHIAMLARNDAGHQIRQAFIDFEKATKNTQLDPMVLLADPNVLRNLLGTYAEKVIALEAEVESQDATITHLEEEVFECQTTGRTDPLTTLKLTPSRGLTSLG